MKKGVFGLVIVIIGFFSPNFQGLSAATFERNLTIGSTGADVSALQQKLKDLGYFTYPTITGRFGSFTRTAVQMFQKANKIVSSGTSTTTGYGKVGPKTRSVLNTLSVVTTSSSSSISPTVSSHSVRSQVVSGYVHREPSNESSTPATPSISWSGNFGETSSNNGTLSGSLIATLSSDTFVNASSTLTESTHFTLANKPAGLTAVVTINAGGTTATLTFTGSATSHANANDVSNLTITFLNGAFTATATASGVTNYSYVSGSINFNDTPSISWSGSFSETGTNNGAISGSLIGTFTSDTFVNAGSTLTESTHFTLANKPAGLTAIVTINGGGTTATLTFSGTATSHANANDVSNLTITFLDGAFTTTSTASSVTNYSYSSGSINFNDTPSISWSGSFTETSDNAGAVSGSFVGTLTSDTFVNAGSTLTESTHFTLANKPAGLTAVVTINGGGTTATLTFTGTATSHANANDVSNLTITFLSGAFTTTTTASTVTNYSYATGSINFNDPVSISWSGSFAETSGNAGALSGSLVGTITGDTFVNASSTLSESTHFTLANKPTGLTAVFTINAGGTTATLTFTGTATSHTNANDVSNLTITFLNGAFTSSSTASSVTNYSYSTGVINFNDPTTVTVAAAGISEPVWEMFQIQVVFSEAVTGFTSSDITASNSTVQNVATSDSISYTADIVPNLAGDIVISISVGVVTPTNTVSNTLNVDVLVPEVIGDLLDDNFDRASLGSDYTDDTPNATVAITSNELVVTKTNSTAGSDNMVYWSSLGAWGLNNKYVDGIYRHTTSFLAGTAGAGPGWRGADAYTELSVFATINANTGGGTYRKLIITRYDGTTASVVGTSSSAFSSMALGDRIEIEMTEADLVVTARAWNLTTDPTKSSPLTATVTFDYFNSTNGVTNYYPAMYFRGGNIVFEEFTAGSNEYKNTEWLLLGDGILQGQRASAYVNGAPNQLHIGLGGASLGHNLITNSAIRASTTDVVLTGLPLLETLNPRRIFIRLGSNDIESARGGTESTGATLALADLQTLVSTLLPYAREGITISTIIAHDTINMTTFNNSIVSTFTGMTDVKVINCFTNSYTSAGSPYTKAAWLTGSGKLNDAGQDYDAGQPATYSDTNYIIANWEL